MAERIIPLYITPGSDREAFFGFKILNGYQSSAQLHSRNISCREEKLLICSVHVFWLQRSIINKNYLLWIYVIGGKKRLKRNTPEAHQWLLSSTTSNHIHNLEKHQIMNSLLRKGEQ